MESDQPKEEGVTCGILFMSAGQNAEGTSESSVFMIGP